MKFLILLLMPLFAGNPVAHDQATVVSGNARFTVLTDRLIRMEWSEDGVFEDRATLGVVNRELDVPPFKVSSFSRGVRIKTAALTLEYRGGGKFGQENLSVSFKMGRQTVVWRPGMDEGGNLLGTTRTLDMYDGFTVFDENGRHTVDPYDKGVASRDGWAIIDESERHVFTSDRWVSARSDGDRQDWYIFAYGHDYLAAVRDFTLICGKIPLPPKWAFGYWWSRYWLYNDFELEDVVGKLRGYGIPADVFVIDMDWHETWGLTSKNPQKDDAGERKGWTGYTWNRDLFPCPENTLEFLHRSGFKTSLNLHPASGIQTYEDCYGRFVEDYTSRTDDYDGPRGYRKPDGSPAFVPYRMSQKAWAQSYFETVLHPIGAQGVDFWWLDWQQWPTSRYIPELNNTFWLNHTFFEDSAQSGTRPMIYHRWGGIGSHRYQVGFSGDTRVSWNVLSYMPWFISTSSNVGYCYWGQDIGGHNEIPGQDRTDAELFTRWVQEGVFTPIFKTHPTRNRNLERRIWMFPEQFDILKEAFRLRYRLSPYIYTAARQAFDTGIGLCRPLYYYFPESEEAYEFKEEYLFGDDILATVVCRPCDPATGLAQRRVWFPSGSDWFDMSTGTLYKGGTVMDLSYSIDENPWYVRSSALIPMASDSIMSLQEPSDELFILAVPGDDKFSTSLYEDGGDNADYEKSCAFTSFSREQTPSGIRVKVGAREGAYESALSSRRLRVVLPGFEAPSAVRINGQDILYSRFPADGTWTYDGASLSVTVWARETSALAETIIECDGRYAFTSGESGLLKRAHARAEAVKYAQNDEDKYKMPPAPKMRWIGASSRITEDPFHAATILSDLPEFPFYGITVDSNTWEADTLGRGLRLLSPEGMHIVEIDPAGDYRLAFAYSEEGLTAAEYGRENGLEVVSTATFGLPHSFVRVDGKTISEISIDASNPRWWMHEAAVALTASGELEFLPYEGRPEVAQRVYKRSLSPNLFSSAPMLIFEGEPVDWIKKGNPKDGFIQKRYPRTALAQLWDGRILLVAVDNGMALKELQAFLMDNFFVRNAINMDGSAALYINGRGNVCNSATERPLNTFITVKKK